MVRIKPDQRKHYEGLVYERQNEHKLEGFYNIPGSMGEWPENER